MKESVLRAYDPDMKKEGLGKLVTGFILKDKKHLCVASGPNLVLLGKI